MLFRQAGIILPGPEGKNISRNNPLTANRILEEGGNKIYLNITYHDQDDADGYPVARSSDVSDSVIQFRYN